MNKSEDGSGPWVGHFSRIRDITDGNCVSLPANNTNGKRPNGKPARRWKAEPEDYWKGIVWQRIAQDRQIWKQHAEAFVQPQDTGCTLLMMVVVVVVMVDFKETLLLGFSRTRHLNCLVVFYLYQHSFFIITYIIMHVVYYLTYFILKYLFNLFM